MMNEWRLLIGFLGLLIVALSVALYPLRKSRMTWFLAPVLVVLISWAYWHWGAWPQWVTHLEAGEKQKRVQAMLKSMDDPAALIAKLKETLRAQPDSARGWYLLGRLYASQNQWHHANDAFAEAHRLEPEDEQFTVNYAQNLWQINNQSFDETSRALLNGVLQRNANQPDALAMLATDAYKRQAYQQAIDYWHRLLKLVSPQSDEAKAIRKAIAKAQSNLM